MKTIQRRTNLFKSALTLLQLFFLFLFNGVNNKISGTISPSNSIIQSTSVTYTFSLNIFSQIPSGGKMTVRFPSDFSFTSASTITCAGIKGFTSNTMSSCSFNYQARILTISGSVFPTTLNAIQFSLSGITNPSYAVQTNQFVIHSYDASSNLLENSDSSLVVTPTTGTFSSISLTPSNPIVGATTSIVLSLTPSHSIPNYGYLYLTLPKWNSFAPTSSQESIIQVATSPGYVTCSPTSGFSASATLTCSLTQSTTTDTLQIQINNGQSSIAAASSIKITINNAQSPPSLTALSNFQLYSTASTPTYLIDKSSTNQLTYSATQAASIPSSLVTLSADTTTKINAVTSMTLRIQNTNPLPVSSSIKIVIPTEIGVTSLSSVTGSGVFIQSSLSVSFSSDKRTITISQFNTDYLEPLSYIYLKISSLTNPSSTKSTSSFQISILDNSNSLVESISSNVLYEATPGTITNAVVTSSNQQLSYNGSQYTFAFTPSESFTKSAILYIIFPTQINATNRINSNIISATSSGGGSLSLNSKAKITVSQNQYATISNLFLSDFSSSSSTSTKIYVTFDGITNSNYLTETDTFKIYLIYKSSTQNTLANIIGYIDSGVTMKFKSNSLIYYKFDQEKNYTGYNGISTITINTVGQTITKGSYINFTIPTDYFIYNSTITEDSCTAISGFSDDIKCTLDYDYTGYYLSVLGGFASNDYNGSIILNFTLTNIMNPFLTIATKSFALYIFDANDNLEYYQNSTYSIQLISSPFAYAMISSTNPYPGQSCLYIFTFTISVDTPQGASMLITLPSEIQIDTSQPLNCTGQLNLQSSISCKQKNATSIQVTLTSTSSVNGVIQNGTTISFQLGYLINPLSMQQSSSFIVQTYITQSYLVYYINQESSNLKITNTKALSVQNLNIQQIGSSELNQKTSLQWSFQLLTTLNSNSYIYLTLPNNIQANAFSSNYQVKFNNIQVSNVIYSKDSRQLSFQTPQQVLNKQDIKIIVSGGISNPINGPYTYQNFLISITSQNGASIASYNGGSEDIIVSCQNNCLTCQNSLSTCLTCSQIQSGMELYLYSSQCILDCPKGMYGETGECKSCQYPCIECSYSSTLCTKCAATYSKPYAYPEELTCFAQCPNGTYLDTTSSLCRKCQTPCLTCSTQSLCLSCDKVNKTNKEINFYQTEQRCYQQCPEGTFQSLQNECLNCTSPCKTCSDQPDLCTSCLPSYFQYGEQCLTTCPKNYVNNLKTMKCDYVTEKSFPVPFTILAFLTSFLLFIANLMKSRTRFFISVMTLTDLILKLNWICLFISLGVDHSWPSFGIILYCLLANFIINFVLWRKLFHIYKIDSDNELQKYAKKYKWTYRILLYLSYIYSFQVFRLTYSRILGMTRFSANFKNSQVYYTLIGRLTVLSSLVLYLPAVVANIIDLIYVKSGSVSFYLDIDSLIIVVYQSILITIVIYKREHVEKSLLDIGELIVQIAEEDDIRKQKEVDELEKIENSRIGSALDKMKRQSLTNKHFNQTNEQVDSNQQEETDQQQQIDESMKDYAQGFAQKILGKIINQYKSSGYSSIDPNGLKKGTQYFSKKSEFVDYNEFWKMKDLLKQSELQLYLLNKKIRMEETKKERLNGEYELINEDYKGILVEEDKIRKEIESLKQYLLEFQDNTRKELEEQEALRRAEIKHKVKMSKLKKVITDVVLKQSEDIIEKGKQKMNSTSNKGGGKKQKTTGPRYKSNTMSSTIRREITKKEIKGFSKKLTNTTRRRSKDDKDKMLTEQKTNQDNQSEIVKQNKNDDSQQKPQQIQNFDFHQNEIRKFREELDQESSQIKEIQPAGGGKKNIKRGKSQNKQELEFGNNAISMSNQKPPLGNLRKELVSQEGVSLTEQKQRNKSLGYAGRQRIQGQGTLVSNINNRQNEFGDIVQAIQRPFTREDNPLNSQEIGGVAKDQWI